MTQDVLEEAAAPETELRQLYQSLLKADTQCIKRHNLFEIFESRGILASDPRMKKVVSAIKRIPPAQDIDFETFARIVEPNLALLRRIILGNLTIPDFPGFCEQIEEIFHEVSDIQGGAVADYIPQLARVDGDLFAVSICTVDGQRAFFGDCEENFCVQSVSKPLTYSLALQLMGHDTVHRHIGYEPSGRSFNEVTFLDGGRPHNPLINAGAIMACSLIEPHKSMADRFDRVLQFWRDMSGGQAIGFDNAVFLSERSTADRNFALGYLMREEGAFPDKTDLLKTLEFYFMCCSIEVNAGKLAAIAATLAGAGRCPFSNKAVLEPETVKSTLSLMSSCGMYDYSGSFAFRIGLPAKSGVSGGIMIVVPNVMGICVWSPPLDQHGNSVRGIKFCEKLVERFNFHNFDSLIINQKQKVDPRQKKYTTSIVATLQLHWACYHGDLPEVERVLAGGVDVNFADYDGRTALHLACAEGHHEVVAYLIHQGAVPTKDRWGHTCLEDARIKGDPQTVELLYSHFPGLE